MTSQNVLQDKFCKFCKTSFARQVLQDKFCKFCNSLHLEVELKYLAEIHDLHNDLSFAPKNLLITHDMLSDVIIEMGE